MRVARWRWLLVPIVVVVAGCLPGPNAPPGFNRYLRAEGHTFTLAQSDPDVLPADLVVAGIRLSTLPTLHDAAGATFGILRCTARCGPEFRGGDTLPVWIVVNPSWTAANGDVIWAVADALTSRAILYYDPNDQ